MAGPPFAARDGALSVRDGAFRAGYIGIIDDFESGDLACGEDVVDLVQTI